MSKKIINFFHKSSKKLHKIETKMIIQINQIDVSIETNLNVFISLSFDSSNRFENQIFIKLTITSETDLKRTIEQNIKQLFDDVLSADDLINQSAKQD